MFWYLFLLIPLAGAFMALRAWLFKATTRPERPEASVRKDAPDEAGQRRIETDMAALIQCRTVSYSEHCLEDENEFQKFKSVLAERFPLVSQTCSCTYIGRRGILYRWASDSDKPARIFMSHYDVVPAEPSDWTHDPFAGKIIDGFIWGRGTLDTKGTLLGIMEAAEELLKQGFEPKQDLYFAFSGEEEIYGGSSADIVSYFESQGVVAEYILDEGGAVVEAVLPGLSSEAALIGIAEKGVANYRLSAKSKGGHASTPPRNSASRAMARAILRLEKKGFKPCMTPPVRAMLQELGRHGNFALRLVAANLWFFRPVLNGLSRYVGAELNAMLHSTIAVTQLSGSPAINVLPHEVSCGLNLRILPGESLETTSAQLKKILKNLDIELHFIDGSEASRISTCEGSGWEQIVQAIRYGWPQAVAAPYLMLAASDSRHYGRISDKVYRFSAMKLSKEERALIHGADERVSLDTLYKTVEFYRQLMQA